MRSSLLFLCVLLLLGLHSQPAGAAEGRRLPNILFILADDMGYGDPQCFNPQSKCTTPNLDRLAAQGCRFTDAHAPGALCTPSRYGLLTGRYPFRPAKLQSGKGALIEPGRMTIASLLNDHGYATAMIGKWHLGFEGGDQFDYTKPLRGGPFDHGFEYFFGQHASLDIPPYFYIENDRCVAPASDHIDEHHSPDWRPIQGEFWRAGNIAKGFKHEEVLPTYTRKAAEYLDQRAHATDGRPFFLYVAFTAPHTPWLPMESLRAPSAGNLYAAWVNQVDESIGQVLEALDRTGQADNTLVFFTSDNGPVWFPDDVKKYGHSAVGTLRGMKADAWEGGHRMPFIARWPARISPGTTRTETICFTDMLATFAAILKAPLPSDAGEDSFSILPLLLGEPPAPRPATIVFTGGTNISIRRGEWKLIPFLGSGGMSKPSRITPKSGDPAGQLYNLATDPGETTNEYAQHPEIVKELTDLLEQLRAQGRSRS